MNWKLIFFFQLFHENFQAPFAGEILETQTTQEIKSLCSRPCPYFPSSRGLKIFMKKLERKWKFSRFSWKFSSPHLPRFSRTAQLHRLFFFCVVEVSQIFPANGVLKIFMKKLKCKSFQDFHENFQALVCWKNLRDPNYTDFSFSV